MCDSSVLLIHLRRCKKHEICAKMHIFSVFNLGIFKGGHLHLFSDENKTLPQIFNSHKH